MRNEKHVKAVCITLPTDLLQRVDASKGSRTRSKTIADMIAFYLEPRKNRRSNAAEPALPVATPERG